MAAAKKPATKTTLAELEERVARLEVIVAMTRGDTVVTPETKPLATGLDEAWAQVREQALKRRGGRGKD